MAMLTPSFRVLRPTFCAGGLGVGMLASRTATLLRQRGEKVAVVEATSGGLMSAALLSLPGASSYYRGLGAIIYGMAADEPRAAFRDLLQDDDVFAAVADPNHGGTAQDYIAGKEIWARSMARRMRVRLGADWCVAESGAAGPTFNVVGVERAFSAIAVDGPVLGAVLVESPGLDREANMRLFAGSALGLLADCIAAVPGSQAAAAQSSDASTMTPSIPGLSWHLDRYGGVTGEVQPEALQRSDAFLAGLDTALALWQEEGRGGVWMHVPLTLAACVPALASRGFQYHHAQNDYCMLTKRLRGCE